MRSGPRRHLPQKLINAAAGHVPLLGVCLGHQAIGQAYGGRIVRAPQPMHGKLSQIHHTGKSVFRGLEDGFPATRYHSLVIERASLPSVLEITAETDDGIIMGVAHKTHPVHGVQFHPESIASAHAPRAAAGLLEAGANRVTYSIGMSKPEGISPRC